MANKISVKSDDFAKEYEPSNSEDEYSEKEKELLMNVRAGRKHKRNDTNEVLRFSEDDESNVEKEDFADSDINDNDEYNIPDSKAWGNKRKAYYNTDFVDQDYDAFNEKEEELAHQEEEEAKAIQQRLAKQLNEGDFFLDSFPQHKVKENDNIDAQTFFDANTLKSDLSDLSKREKLLLFYKDSPEFQGIIKDFERFINESDTILQPILKLAVKQKIQLPAIEFAKTRNNIILTYCSNITFYLLLKSKHISIKNHPVIKRLVQLRNLITQLDEKFDNVVKPQLEKLVSIIEAGKEVKLSNLAKPKKLNLLKSFGDKRSKKTFNAMEAFDFEDEDMPTKNLESHSEESKKEEEDANDLDDNQRRGITYQIAKNKGLTPHRKKELRNPRVKHRNKFRKALVRRKGAVRTLRNEVKRYGGEISGIKATVKKGIKIKS